MKPSPRAALELAVWFLPGRELPEPAHGVLRQLAKTVRQEGLATLDHGVWRADFTRLPSLSNGLRIRLLDLGFTAARSLLLQSDVDPREHEALPPVLARAFEQSRLWHHPMITRALLRANPDVLFVFGDNLQGAGFGGQAAEMRGEPNAVGIPTKRAPRMTADAFFSDQDLPEVLRAFEGPFQRLRAHLEAGKDIVMPEAGIGTGFAKLEQKAPAIHKELERRLLELDMMAMSPVVLDLLDGKNHQNVKSQRPHEDTEHFDGP